MKYYDGLFDRIRYDPYARAWYGFYHNIELLIAYDISSDKCKYVFIIDLPGGDRKAYSEKDALRLIKLKAFL